tara:strand:- start:3426 stop:3710 length:285 start_codon:yes stop_codon:yes gene_type:complete
MIVIALNNQTLLDIAIQTTGKAENWLKIAMANDLVPTAPIAPGTVLMIPDTVDSDEAIVRYYSANGVVPATGLTEVLQIVELNCEQKLYECFKD